MREQIERQVIGIAVGGVREKHLGWTKQPLCSIILAKAHEHSAVAANGEAI
jgi:hypothetical protein